MLWRPFRALLASLTKPDKLSWPLDVREVKHIANSVSKWVWTHYTGRMSAEAFSKRQSGRGAKGGRISAKARKAEAGSPEAFSEKMKDVRANRKRLGKPWEDLGISRSQWYRDRKSLNENNSQR